MWKASGFLDSSQRPGWIMSGAALTTLVVFPQTGNYTLVLGLLSVWVTLWVSQRRYAHWIPVLAVLASLWIFHVAGACLSELEHLLIPVSLAMLQTFQWRHHKRSMARSGRAVEIEAAVLPLPQESRQGIPDQAKPQSSFLLPALAQA